MNLQYFHLYLNPLLKNSTRDELKRHYTLGEYWLEVEMEDLASFDEDLSDCLYKLPTENLPLVRMSHHTNSVAARNLSVRRLRLKVCF